MSQENVELIQGAHAAVNGRDLDALLGLVHPEVEFQSLIAEAEGRDYPGVVRRGSPAASRACSRVRYSRMRTTLPSRSS